MELLRGKRSAAFITVILIAGSALYAIRGGSSGSDGSPGSIDRPYNAIEMKVGSVRADGTFPGEVELADRYAQDGLESFGADGRVRLRLVDLEAPDAGDRCWAEESTEAIEDLIGGRIWVDPKSIVERRSGTFTVYAWNRSDAFVQEQLLRDGDGKIIGDGVSYPTYRDVLTVAEGEAAKADRGLWGACGVS